MTFKLPGTPLMDCLLSNDSAMENELDSISLLFALTGRHVRSGRDAVCKALCIFLFRKHWASACVACSSLSVY